MKNALILHGLPDAEEYFEMDFPSPSNAHWLPWLQQKFLRADILCQTPEMPHPYNPQYNDWKNTFEQFDITSETIIVAHSAGCGFILKYLNENTEINIDNLIFVAPWRDPYKEKGDFLTYKLTQSLADRNKSLHIFHSLDDGDDIQKTVEEIIKTYPNAHYHKFENKGHFCLGDLGTTKFPELWETCSKII